MDINIKLIIATIGIAILVTPLTIAFSPSEKLMPLIKITKSPQNIPTKNTGIPAKKAMQRIKNGKNALIKEGEPSGNSSKEPSSSFFIGIPSAIISCFAR